MICLGQLFKGKDIVCIKKFLNILSNPFKLGQVIRRANLNCCFAICIDGSSVTELCLAMCLNVDLTGGIFFIILNRIDD